MCLIALACVWHINAFYNNVLSYQIAIDLDIIDLRKSYHQFLWMYEKNRLCQMNSTNIQSNTHFS